MVYLMINSDLCIDCGNCELILGGFRTKFDGIIPISSFRYDTESSIRDSCQSVIAVCEEHAIYLKGSNL